MKTKIEWDYNGVPDSAMRELEEYGESLMLEWENDMYNLSLHRMVRGMINLRNMCMGLQPTLDDLVG